MIIDKIHRQWFFVSVILLAVASLSYVAYAAQAANGPRGGSVMGLLYGIIGTLMIVFAGLLAARKQVPTWRIGAAQFWLRGHIWLGLLSLPLILFHSGFGWGGLLENLLWITFAIVYGSGLFGLVLQQVLPRVMTNRIPHETFGAQIPYQCQAMQFLGDKLISESCGKLDIQSDPLLPVAESVAKQRKWLKRESDFRKLIAGIYVDGQAAQPEENTAAPEKTPEKPAGKSAKSKIEQARAAVANKSTEGSTKPMSKIEQARAAAAKKNTADSHKPMSKIEQARAAAAKKSSPVSEKPMSPLEQARAQAAKRTAVPQSPGDETKAAAAKTESGPDKTIVDDVQKELDAIKRVLSDKYGYDNQSAEAAAQRSRSFLATGTPEATTAAVIVACPSCQYQLKLPNRSLLGRVARCPQCRHKFVLEDPEQAEQEAADAAAAVVAIAKAMGAGTRDSRSTIALARAQDEKSSPRPRTRKKNSGPRASILEQVRAQAAAGKKSAGAMSKLQQARSQASTQAAASKSPPKIRAAAQSKQRRTEKPASDTKKRSKEPIPRADRLKAFYLDGVRAFLGLGRRGSTWFDRLAVAAESNRAFAQMRVTLPAELHPALAKLEEFCEERRQFTLQLSIHRWLHWWLLLHVPVSIAMFVLMIAHIVMALRVVPFGL